jgi:hypothetical protein
LGVFSTIGKIISWLFLRRQKENAARALPQGDVETKKALTLRKQAPLLPSAETKGSNPSDKIIEPSTKRRSDIKNAKEDTEASKRPPLLKTDYHMEPQEKLSPPSSRNYSREFLYLDALIRYRMLQAFRVDEHHREPPMPDLDEWSAHLKSFINKSQWKDLKSAKILMLVALAPYLFPDLFDRAIFEELEKHKRDRIDRIGGVKGKNCPFFLPTGETAIFLIAGGDHQERLKVQELFGAEHDFWERKILWLEDLRDEEPPMHGRIIMSTDYVDLVTSGRHRSPQFSISFPARRIQHTDRTIDDLVISRSLRTQIEEIKSWLMYKDELQSKFGNLIKRGYRTLFYGPPGTGKTFTAMILGNDLDREVYKIDLSMIVSKYIGETEKNLEQLFSRAKDKDWVLFFDEADALFGKRTNVRDAHDKYANQEVSYLLQRIEDYDGLVILATNMKNNIDDAFCRRFNSVLHFPFPEAEQRYILWVKSFFPESEILDNDIIIPDTDRFVFIDRPGSETRLMVKNVAESVKKYELSGGSIINVVQYSIIKSMERYHQMRRKSRGVLVKEQVMISDGPDDDPCNPEPEFILYLSEIIDGIRNELIKEGKPFR